MSFGDVIWSAAAPTSTASIQEVGGDASTIWACGYGGANKVYELSPTDFSVIRTANSPLTYPFGIGGDATVIWHCNGFPGSAFVYELSITDFSVIRSGNTPTGEGQPQGIGGNVSIIWFCGTQTDKVYELSPTDFSVINSASSPSTGAIGIGGETTAVWHCDSAVARVYALSYSDLSVIQWAASPSNSPTGIGGSTHKLWHCDSGTQLIYELDAATGGMYLERGTLRIEGTQEQYGDGSDLQRNIEGLLVGSGGTARQIGVYGNLHRYVDEAGNLRYSEGDDTTLDATAGAIGYEDGGTNLRYGDASGNKRQEEGALA